MTKSYLRALVGAFGIAAMSGIASLASAATLSYNDPNCSDFTLGGSVGARTFVCVPVVAGPPVCAVTGPTTGVIGTPVTLTASCSPAATSYMWAGGNCTGLTTSTCSATSGIPVAFTYTVAGTNASGPGPVSPLFTVTWSATVQPPSGCTLTATPSSLAAPGNVTLTAACLGGGAPTSYAWTGPGVVTPTSASSQVVNVAATATFGVTPSNGGGNGNTANATVTVGGGGGGGPVSCTGFTKTVYIDMGWPDYSALKTTDYGPGGFNGGDALVIHIKPPAGSSSIPGTAGSLLMKEYAGPTANRYAVLSTQPCSFVGTFGWLDGNAIPVLWSGTSVDIQSIQVNMQQYQSQVKLLPGVDYYLNIKNTMSDGVTPSCGTGNCNMIINWTKPPGT